MIQEALQYIVKLASEPIQVGEYRYHKDKMILIEPPHLEAIDIPSLDGFIMFCQSMKSPKDIFICLIDERLSLMSRDLKNGYHRDCYAFTILSLSAPADSAVLSAKSELEKRVPTIECYL